MLWEDAVYQGRELFFKGESCSSRELFFGRVDAIRQEGGRIYFINKGWKHCPLTEGCHSSTRDRERRSLRKGRTAFIEGESHLSMREGAICQ